MIQVPFLDSHQDAENKEMKHFDTSPILFSWEVVVSGFETESNASMAVNQLQEIWDKGSIFSDAEAGQEFPALIPYWWIEWNDSLIMKSLEYKNISAATQARAIQPTKQNQQLSSYC